MNATNQVSIETKAKKSWLRVFAKVACITILILIITGLIAQRMSDGPTQFIPGGKLRTGTLISTPDVDWSLINSSFIELQLVEPMGSRITGYMIHEGQLYVPCDLGFMWRRFDGAQGWILHAI